MPIYEYKCPKCGHVFEEWVKSSEAHKEEPCPECGTPSPRIISRTSFVLKGNGWYVSDYGYRKGITEDGETKVKTPAKAKPVTPVKQGEKSLAKTDSLPKTTKTEKSASTAAKTSPEAAAPKPATASPSASGKK